METGAKDETLTDINYDSNYSKIFENNGLKLDKQILTINKLNIYLSKKSFSKINYKNKNDGLF